MGTCILTSCFLSILIVLVGLVGLVCGEMFPECDDIPSGTFISSPLGCELYIYCDGAESFESSCSDGQWFNSNEGYCDDPENVSCDIPSENPEEPVEMTSASPEEDSGAPTTTIPDSTVNAMESTLQNIEESGVSGPTTLIITTTPSATANQTDESSGSESDCPEGSSEITFIQHPSSCENFYMCYQGSAVLMTCPSGLEFSAMRRGCDWPHIANCKVIGVTTVSPRKMCTNDTTGYFDYPHNCHYYYRCVKGLLTIQECAVGFGWDSNRKECSSKGCS